ncbi:MarC family protein [Streptosporangium sp. CA-135522]|uniref:MarC family protein n=1 Tax=Streptosporangium sp. CA-135522 TaxID=3240072 RepID=UPI003D94FA8A
MAALDDPLLLHGYRVHPAGRLLKDNGLNLVTRIMGLLAAAIAVELVAGAVLHWV